MHHRPIIGITCLAFLAIATGSAAAASDPPIGSPRPQQTTIVGFPQPGSFIVDPAPAPDPVGGPPWGFGTFITTHGVPCMVQGRIVAGRVGEIDEAGVFHAFEPGAGDPGCYGAGIGPAGLRGDASSDRSYLTKGDRQQCAFGPVPRGSRARSCPPHRIRFVRSGLYGPGITDVAVRTGRAWKPVRVSPEGGFTVVHPRLYSDSTLPDIRIHASACGSLSRRDLLKLFTRVSRRGCVITMYLPGGPRPTRESKRSLHNRHDRHLRVRLRVAPSNALIRHGYRLTFRLPITIRDVGTEGYAFSVQGPRGSRCRYTRPPYRTQTFSDYRFAEGKTESFDIRPTRTSKAFCPGRYRIKVAFARDSSTRRRVGAPHYRLLGVIDFRVPR